MNSSPLYYLPFLYFSTYAEAEKSVGLVLTVVDLSQSKDDWGESSSLCNVLSNGRIDGASGGLR